MLLLSLELNAFLFPFFFIFVSLLVARLVPFKNWFGKPRSLVHFAQWAFLILIALLGVAFATGIIAEQLGIHDMQEVDASIDTIAREPFSGIVQLILSAAGEELFFRGVLQTIIGTFSIPLFAIMHAGYGSVTQIAAALVGGIVLFLGREKSGSIYPGLIAHFLYNVLAVFFIQA